MYGYRPQQWSLGPDTNIDSENLVVGVSNTHPRLRATLKDVISRFVEVSTTVSDLESVMLCGELSEKVEASPFAGNRAMIAFTDVVAAKLMVSVDANIDQCLAAVRKQCGALLAKEIDVEDKELFSLTDVNALRDYSTVSMLPEVKRQECSQSAKRAKLWIDAVYMSMTHATKIQKISKDALHTNFLGNFARLQATIRSITGDGGEGPKQMALSIFGGGDSEDVVKIRTSAEVALAALCSSLENLQNIMAGLIFKVPHALGAQFVAMKVPEVSADMDYSDPKVAENFINGIDGKQLLSIVKDMMNAIGLAERRIVSAGLEDDCKQKMDALKSVHSRGLMAVAVYNIVKCLNNKATHILLQLPEAGQTDEDLLKGSPKGKFLLESMINTATGAKSAQGLELPDSILKIVSGLETRYKRFLGTEKDGKAKPASDKAVADKAE